MIEQEETPCPWSPDDVHCVHWWDCAMFCYCKNIGIGVITAEVLVELRSYPAFEEEE